MFPRKPLAFWQDLAHAQFGSALVFANSAGACETESRAGINDCDLASRAQFDPYFYPSPTTFPGPSWVGISFARRHLPLRQSLADGEIKGIFRFSAPVNALMSAATTTMTRGRPICALRFLSWQSLPRRFPLAAPMTRSVRSLVQPLVRWWPMQPAAMPQPARLLAQSAARSATILPALATDHLIARPDRRVLTQPKAIRAFVRMAFCFAPRPELTGRASQTGGAGLTGRASLTGGANRMRPTNQTGIF